MDTRALVWPWPLRGACSGHLGGPLGEGQVPSPPTRSPPSSPVKVFARSAGGSFAAGVARFLGGR
jgi:hypothetical protein